MDLDIDTYAHDDWWVVSVHGDVDIATAPRLREVVIGLVSDGHLDVVIDLGAVDFLDSTGLGAIVGALKRVRTHGGDLRLVCTNSRIRKVFELTGLDRVFVMADSIETAVG